MHQEIEPVQINVQLVQCSHELVGKNAFNIKTIE